MLGCSGLAVLGLVLMVRAQFDVAMADLDTGEDFLSVWVFMIAVSLFALGLSRMPRLRRRLKT